MTQIVGFQVKKSRKDLVKNLSSIPLAQWTIFIYSFEKLSIFTVLHKNINFAFVLDDLIDLHNILMNQCPLMLNFLLYIFNLAGIQRDVTYFDGHNLTCRFMNGFLDSTKTSKTNSFL